MGGLFKGLVEAAAGKQKWPKEQKDLAENTGTLLASGLIAGEAIIGILFAALAFAEVEMPQVFASPSYLLSLLSMGILGAILVAVPRRRAIRPA